MWFPGVGALPLRQDEAPRSLSGQQARLAAQCPTVMQNEPPSGQQTVDEKPSSQGSWTPYPTTNTFGTSFGIKPSTDSQRPPNLPVRGGIQVLPPVVPPRAVNGSINSGAPVATPRPKPKPPLPPKRDELTRLTTVRRDTVNHQPPSAPVRLQRTDDPSHQQLDQGIPDVVPTHVKPEEKQVDPSPPEIPPRPEESALRVLQQPDIEENAPEEELPSDLELPRLDEELPQENSLESPSSEDGATADIWVRVIESPIKKRPSGEELTSQPSSRHASTSDDGEERDSKPPLKKESRPPPKHRVVLDKSYIKCIQDSSDNVNPNKSKEAQTPSSVDQSSENAAQQLTSNQCTNISNDPAKRLNSRAVVGSESLPCSRPSSRATSRSSSPASFIGEKPSNSKSGRISAAEALGVVAKPCPRPPSAKRPKQPQEYRRQSLGNLSDSKLSVSYDPSCSSISCTIRGLWSSVGETEAVSDAVREYRKHDRTHRGSSADGSRTLSRIKFDCGHPPWDVSDSLQGYLDRDSHSVTGYSTLSRIGRSKTEKYFARSTTPVQSGYSSGDSSSVKDDIQPKKTLKAGKSEKLDASGRPKSTCNCGHHTASSVRVDTGKRTFSVEELTSAFARQCSEFSRASSGSGSARGSFGKSPRVTFALAEDMGASGGAIAKHPESDRPPTGGASKKILRGKSLPNPSTDSDDGGDPRTQQKQFQGGGSLLPGQVIDISII